MPPAGKGALDLFERFIDRMYYLVFSIYIPLDRWILFLFTQLKGLYVSFLESN